MNPQLKKQLCRLCPNEDLEVALKRDDYVEAMGVIIDSMDQFGIVESSSELFKLLYNAFQNDDENSLLEILKWSRDVSCLELALDVVEFYSSFLNKEDKKYPTDQALADHFKTLTFLNELEEKTEEDYLPFIKMLLKCKRKKSMKRAIFKSVLGIELQDDLTYAYSSLSEYVEALILHEEISALSIFTSFIDDDPFGLMEQIKVQEYLRQRYLELKQENIEDLESQINSIAELGLRRDKPNKNPFE